MDYVNRWIRLCAIMFLCYLAGALTLTFKVTSLWATLAMMAFLALEILLDVRAVRRGSKG